MSVPTVKKYIDILEGSLLLRRLEPLHVNLSKRIVKAPKIYLRDTGLMHHLLGIGNVEVLHGSLHLGASWETYVIEGIYRAAGKRFRYAFFRTHTGAEVDLVLETPTQRRIFIEIKYSSNPTPSKGFYTAVADLAPNARYIIVPEGEKWQRSPELYVCGLQ